MSKIEAVRSERRPDRWLPEEEAALNDPSFTSDEERAKTINRTVDAIRQKRRVLRLGKVAPPTTRRWSRELDRIVMSAEYGTNLDKAYTVGRTLGAVEQRRLLLSRLLEKAKQVEALEVDLALAESPAEAVLIRRALGMAIDARKQTAHLR